MLIGFKLEEWHKGDYYRKQYELCDKILKGEDPSFKDTIERVHVDDLTFEEFIERYEKGSRPVIIKGVVDKWPAKHAWTVKVSESPMIE